MRKYEKSLPTSEAVEAKLREIEEEQLLPKGMKISIFNQRTDLVHVTTHNVLHNLVVGMALVIAILFIFLGNLTSAGIVAIMIPLALLFAVTVLYAQGKSANLLSIGAVDFGIIVDSSVIIVENIYRHLTAHDSDRSLPLIDRIIAASHEIERALFFSTTIIVCAFIPLFSDDRSGGGPVRPDGQYLCLLDLRSTAPGRHAGASALLIPLPRRDGGEGDDRRPAHEAPLPSGPQTGLESSLAHPGAHGRRRDLHVDPDPRPRRGVHAAARRGESLDSRPHAPHRLAGGGSPRGAAAARGHRVGSRSPRGHVAGRPAR